VSRASAAFRVPLALALAVLAALGLCSLPACERDAVPPLVEVTAVNPRAIEVGDRLELAGTGYPQGRTARLTFRGSLFRPGQPEVQRAAIEAEGVVVGSDRIEVLVTDALEDAFCGHGDRAAHTTMTGDVEVAFASSAPGAPPLVGTMRGVSLDVTPSSVRASVLASRSAEGARVLDYLGVVPGPATPRGLPIERITAGSPAEHAGFQVGDVITTVDGVHVREVSDVIPASARSTRITIRHGDSGAEETKSLTMAAFASERIPVEYAPALLVVGLALAVLLLLVLPAPVVASELELRVARHLRAGRARTFVRALFGRGPRTIAAVLVSVLVATFAFGPYVLAPDLDAVFLLLAAVALLVAARVTTSRGGMAAVRAAGEVMAYAVVLGLAVAGAFVHAGAMRLVEIVRAQGGLPWEVASARHPVGLVLGFAYLAGLVALLRAKDDAPLRADARLDDVAAASAKAPPSRSGLLLERVGLVLACALAAAMFFGGWQVPGLDARGTAREVLGAVTFVAKTWGLAGAVLACASLATPWTAAQARSFVWKRLAPALLAGGLLVAAARRLGPSESLELAAGVTVVAAAALLAIRAALRVRAAMRSPEPHASPFL